MAVAADTHYLRQMIDRGHVRGDVLEIGSRDWQGGEGNMAPTVGAAGLAWTGCDLEAGPGVDFTVDILDPAAVAAIDRRWDTVLLFNLLEHVYDPPAALRHAVDLVTDGGSVVVCGPAIWEIHRFPRDYWRPLPDFYREFADRHGLSLAPDGFCWVLNEWPYVPSRPPVTRVIPVADLIANGVEQVPSRLTSAAVWGKPRAAISAAVQRGLNLTGRVTRFPNVGLGVVMTKN